MTSLDYKWVREAAWVVVPLPCAACSTRIDVWSEDRFGQHVGFCGSCLQRAHEPVAYRELGGEG